jgi:hypothetical protein
VIPLDAEFRKKKIASTMSFIRASKGAPDGKTELGLTGTLAGAFFHPTA